MTSARFLALFVYMSAFVHVIYFLRFWFVLFCHPFLIVSASADDCLERLICEITYYVPRVMSN